MIITSGDSDNDDGAQSNPIIVKDTTEEGSGTHSDGDNDKGLRLEGSSAALIQINCVSVSPVPYHYWPCCERV